MTSLLQDVNPYKEDEFRKKFISTPLFKQLEKDFDCLLWNSRDIYDFPKGVTPRQYFGDSTLWKTKFSLLPFYYLEFLTEQNPKEIYDLGCGWNIYKKYIPSVIGIGAERLEGDWFHGDIHDYVDDEFIKGHQNYFESVFAICSLHFYPMSKLRQRVLDFASMIRPSGRGFITFNAIRMIEQDPTMANHPNLELWIRQELYNLPFKILQFDLDLNNLKESIDGNIRLVLEK